MSFATFDELLDQAIQTGQRNRFENGPTVALLQVIKELRAKDEHLAISLLCQVARQHMQLLDMTRLSTGPITIPYKETT